MGYLVGDSIFVLSEGIRCFVCSSKKRRRSRGCVCAREGVSDCVNCLFRGQGECVSRHVHGKDGLAHDHLREVLDHVRVVVHRVGGVHLHRGGRRHEPLEDENRREGVRGSQEQRSSGGAAAAGLVTVGAGGGGSHLGCCRVLVLRPLFVFVLLLFLRSGRRDAVWRRVLS
jgi:hypothetical protein